jgi:hypothetical protein
MHLQPCCNIDHCNVLVTGGHAGGTAFSTAQRYTR